MKSEHDRRGEERAARKRAARILNAKLRALELDPASVYAPRARTMALRDVSAEYDRKRNIPRALDEELAQKEARGEELSVRDFMRYCYGDALDNLVCDRPLLPFLRVPDYYVPSRGRP